MNSFVANFKKDKINSWILYFLLLGTVQALWTNQHAFPPMVFRLGMVAAVFAPMILNRELVIFGFPFFLILRGQLSTAYQYLPDINSLTFYIFLLFIFLIFHWKSIQPIKLRSTVPLLVLMLYMGIVDLIGTTELGNYSKNIFIVIVFSLFITNKHDLDIFSASLILVCVFSAIYYIVMYDQFLVTWNVKEGIERSGWKDPNYFSTFMNVGVMLSLLYLLGNLKSNLFILNKRIILLISCLAIIIAVVLTASRAGFLSFAFIFVVSIFLSKPNIKIVLTSIGIIFIAVIIMLSHGVFDTLLYRLFEQDNISSAGGRTDIWLNTIRNFNIQSYGDQLFGRGYWHRTFLSGGADTHNEFIAILADYGYLGVSIFLWLIASMLSFKKGIPSRIMNISAIFYLLSIVSLSPFQYVNIGFLIIWILSVKKLRYTLQS